MFYLASDLPVELTPSCERLTHNFFFFYTYCTVPVTGPDKNPTLSSLRPAVHLRIAAI